MSDLPDYTEDHLLSDADIEAAIDAQLASVSLMAAVARTPRRGEAAETRSLADEYAAAQQRVRDEMAEVRHFIVSVDPGWGDDVQLYRGRQDSVHAETWAFQPVPAVEKPPARDLPEFTRVLAALEEPPPMLETDAELVRSSAAVFRSRIERMRGLKVARENAILHHALNSLELGLMGLERVAGTEAGDGHAGAGASGQRRREERRGEGGAGIAAADAGQHEGSEGRGQEGD